MSRDDEFFLFAIVDGPRIIILMGVAGSGKTTVGKFLAAALGWPFYDADAFHSGESLAKMSRGISLTDIDREPWLRALHHLLQGIAEEGGTAVLACSALKQSYRDALTGALSGIRCVHLKAEKSTVEERLRSRKHHYFGPALLESQFEILEEPEDALAVAADAAPQDIVAAIQKGLGLASDID